MRNPCLACDRPVGKDNKSGYCQACYPEFARTSTVRTRTVKALPERMPEMGLLKKDEAYRKQMEQANAMFVARLSWALAA